MPTLKRPPTLRATRLSAGGTRSLLVVLAVGALLAGGVALLNTTAPTRGAISLGLAAERTLQRSGSPAEKAFAGAEPGSCLTWTATSAVDFASTSCADPHLFEVAAEVDLSVYPGAEFGPNAPLPGALRLTTLRSEVCTPAVRAYLHQRFDPYGAYTVGLINPGAAAWGAGERSLRCGLQNVGHATTPFPVTGRVADTDQSDVTAAGTCLGINGTVPADPVDCAQQHSSQTVAVVDLSARFPGGHPSTADQDTYLEKTCAAAADTFLGAGGGTTGGTAGGTTGKGLTVFWDNVRYESWTVGSTRVNCSIGQQQGGGFAPVTGDARRTADTGAAAPPATTKAASPTTPSTSTPSTPAPSTKAASPTTPSGR